eukprot:GHVU01199529.1.p1 GENE.GHVU01199529.1~~GHVU01199529.1.p1  ORF type:complete len:200 (+),score=21.58 GHVU01199529.1:287-886(+)
MGLNPLRLAAWLFFGSFLSLYSQSVQCYIVRSALPSISCRRRARGTVCRGSPHDEKATPPSREALRALLMKLKKDSKFMNPDEFLAQAEFLTEGIINSSPSKSKALERFPKLSKEVAAVVPSDFGNEDDNFAANGVDEHGLPIYTNEDITKLSDHKLEEELQRRGYRTQGTRFLRECRYDVKGSRVKGLVAGKHSLACR